MIRLNFGALEKFSRFQYLCLSVIVSIVAALFLGMLFHDSGSDLVFWVLTGAAGGIILGLIEHSMIRKLKQKRTQLDASKTTSAASQHGRP